jgi:carbonic anhydrase/acetyltransferase-like protein (isoleucine patch superfamily)
MTAYILDGRAPQLPEAGRYWIAPSAAVIGHVRLGEDVGVWFGAVLRGDLELIDIGSRTNIQEHCVVHTDPGAPASVGRNCTIGHRALLHGCTIGDNSLIGIGATVLNHAVIGENCLIGAHTLITEGKTIPPGSLVFGSPARVVRSLEPHEIQRLKTSADVYVMNLKRFASGLKPLSPASPQA